MAKGGDNRFGGARETLDVRNGGDGFVQRRPPRFMVRRDFLRI